MKKPQNQTDIVNTFPRLGDLGSEVTEQLRMPGLETLHLQNKEDIASVLVQILKQKRNLVAINWRFGEKFEVTYRNDPL